MDSLQQQNGCDQYCPILGASPKRFSWIIYKFWDWIQVKQTWHPSGSILQGCTRPVYLYLCPVGIPKNIDALPALHMPVVFSMPYEHAHTPCGHSHYVLWAFPLCPVGIPIMPCGHSQSPYFILCPIHRLSSACPLSIPPWGPICPVGIPVMPVAFPLCPVGFSFMPCGHSHYVLWAFTLFPVGTAKSESQPPFHIVSHMPVVFSMPSIPPWTSICPMGIPLMPCGYSNHALWAFPTATDALGFSVTWFSHRPWKVLDFLIRSWKLLDFPICLENYHFFLENCLKRTLVGLKN